MSRVATPASSDGNVRVWDVRSGRYGQIFQSKFELNSAAFSPTVAASSQPHQSQRPALERQDQAQHGPYGRPHRRGQLGRLLTKWSAHRHRIQQQDGPSVGTAQRPPRRNHQRPPRRGVSSRPLPRRHSPMHRKRQCTARLWNTQNLQPVATLSGHTGEVRSCASRRQPLGHREQRRNARVWDITSGQTLLTNPRPQPGRASGGLFTGWRPHRHRICRRQRHGLGRSHRPSPVELARPRHGRSLGRVLARQQPACVQRRQSHGTNLGRSRAASCSSPSKTKPVASAASSLCPTAPASSLLVAMAPPASCSASVDGLLGFGCRVLRGTNLYPEITSHCDRFPDAK